LRPVIERTSATLRRTTGHPGTPAPAGGHERSARRSHWYREAELTRAVFADLELRDATGEPDDVTVARFRGAAKIPDPLPVRAAGAFGRFLRTLMVIADADGTHLMTRTPSGAELLHDPETARAVADDLPTDWKDGRDLDLDPVGTVVAVHIVDR